MWMEFVRFFSWLSGLDKTLAKAIKNQILICERERESHMIASHAITDIIISGHDFPSFQCSQHSNITCNFSQNAYSL